MPRALMVIIVCLLLGFCACCPLTSVQPLSRPQAAAYDARLEGVWQVVSANNEMAFCHVSKAPNNHLQVLLVEHKDNGEIAYAALTIFATHIADDRYLNIDLEKLPKEHNQNHEGYLILKYNLTDKNTLVLSVMALDPIVTAIQTHKLAGEVIYDQNAAPSKAPSSESAPPRKADCARITDSSARIRNYLTTVDLKQLFPPYLTFKRLNTDGS